MNELHANGEIPETAEHCEELLSSALQGSELQETIDEVASTQRRVVHEDDHIIVLDSRIDDQWQRCAMLQHCSTSIACSECSGCCLISHSLVSCKMML